MATIGAPFGVRGAFRLKTMTENPQDALAHDPLRTDQGTTFSFKLVRIENQNTLIVESPQCKDRTVAEQLRGTKFYTLKENLRKDDLLEEGTFYVHDLVGANVEDQNGASLGTVYAIENYGASDILIIKTPDAAYLQVALIEESVPVIDLAQHRVTVIKEHVL